jgi:glycosyltransferase involved in cell wall biosynthesis
MSLCVLHVIPQIETGGAERVMLDSVAGLVKAGGRALVYSAGGRMVPELERLGGLLRQGPATSKNPYEILVSNANQIADLITSERVDVVHAHSRAPAWSALVATRRTRTPFVTTYHGIYNAKSALKRWYNSVMARGDVVIANSHFTYDYLMAQHGTDPKIVSVIPCGIDVDRFSRAAIKPERIAHWRTRWDLQAETRPIVMLPARLTHWKGQRVFIEALALLRQRGRDCLGLLVGDAQGRTAYEDGLREQIATLGLQDCVRLVGHCEDMPAALCLADVAVCPSIEAEAFGLTAAEAQAMGVPVIGSDLGGARETIVHGVTGYLSPPGDQKALADHVESLLAMSAEERTGMGARGVEHINAHYSVVGMQAATLAVYHRVVAENRLIRL